MGSSSTIPYNIQTRHDTPTLYCLGGEFTNNASTMTQTVLFKHKTSKVEVVVDTRGLFSDNGGFVKNITSISADLLAQGKITTTSLNLFTGSLSTTHVPATIFSNDFPLTINNNLVDRDGFNKAQTYTSAKSSSTAVYTSLAPNAANFSVKIKGLSVLRSLGFTSDSDVDTIGNIADGTTGAIITNANEKTATFSSSTSSNTVGKLLKLNIRFGDPGVLLRDRYWSKGYLYFRTMGSGANASDEYRIDRVRKRSLAFKNTSNAHRHYYWRYNMLYPYSMTRTLENQEIPGDACARLHPLGVWRSPTKQDFINLVNTSTAVTSPAGSPVLTFERFYDGVANNTLTPNDHLVIRIGTGTESASNKYLYLSALGYYHGNTSTPPQHRAGEEGAGQAIEINTLNFPHLNRWGIKIFFASGTGTQRRFSLLDSDTSVAPVTYNMNDPSANAFGQDSGHALRCVRNN